MKKAIAIGLLLLLTMGLLTGCGAKYRSVSKIKSAGELVVYTDARWAPFEYIGEGGKQVGVDMDIAAKIAEHLGVSLRIIDADFDGMSIAVQNGQADLALAAITITDERKESLDFSIPYTDSCQYIIVQEGSSVASINDLGGVKIGVHLGTTGDFLASDEVDDGVLTGTGASVVQYKALQEAALALQKGDLGAIICDDRLAMNLSAVNAGLTCFPAAYSDGPIEAEQYGVAIGKGNSTLVDEVNIVLKNLITSGYIEHSLAFHDEQAAIR